MLVHIPWNNWTECSWNLCWNYNQQEGTFYHGWWTCKKARKCWNQLHIIIQKILKTHIQLKPETFILGLFFKQLEKIFSYMTTVVRLCNAQRWKKINFIHNGGINSKDDGTCWNGQIVLIRNKILFRFNNDWKPLIIFKISFMKFHRQIPEKGKGKGNSKTN